MDKKLNFLLKVSKFYEDKMTVDELFYRLMELKEYDTEETIRTYKMFRGHVKHKNKHYNRKDDLRDDKDDDRKIPDVYLAIPLKHPLSDTSKKMISMVLMYV